MVKYLDTVYFKNVSSSFTFRGGYHSTFNNKLLTDVHIFLKGPTAKYLNVMYFKDVSSSFTFRGDHHSNFNKLLTNVLIWKVQQLNTWKPCTPRKFHHHSPFVATITLNFNNKLLTDIHIWYAKRLNG